jgi:hypothetical protein
MVRIGCKELILLSYMWKVEIDTKDKVLQTVPKIKNLLGELKNAIGTEPYLGTTIPFFFLLSSAIISPCTHKLYFKFTFCLFSESAFPTSQL